MPAVTRLQNARMLLLRTETSAMALDAPPPVARAAEVHKKRARLSGKRSSGTRPPACLESTVRDALCLREAGTVEVHCRAGVVDVVTKGEVIEIKRSWNWKSGIGQVLAYCRCFPGKTPRLHLYGAGLRDVSFVGDLCSDMGIRLTLDWEETPPRSPLLPPRRGTGSRRHPPPPSRPPRGTLPPRTTMVGAVPGPEPG